MKKIVKSLLLVGLALSITACGTSKKESGEEKNNKLTVWAWNTNVPIIEKAGELYKDKNKDFELEIVEIANQDVYKKTTTGLQAGGKGLPDIVLIEDDKVPEYVNNYPDSFVNLSEEGFSSHESEFPEFKLNVGKNDSGDIYAIPFDVGPVAVFYRTDLFKEAGIDVEKIITWDDYISAGKVLNEKTGAKLVPIEEDTNDIFYRIMMNQQGTYYFNNDNELAFTSKESIRSMEMIKKLVDSGVTESVSDWNGQTASFVNGDVATLPSGAWLSSTIMAEAKDQSGKWGVFPLPVFTDNNVSVAASNAGGSSFLIPSSGENKELAYEFMEFFALSEEVQVTAMADGIFPSLMSSYETDKLPEETLTYFGGQNIYEFFGNELSEVPLRKYNQYSAEAKEQIKIAQSLILDGKNIEEALKNANDELKNQIE
ncbi:ABC transporter substrate-binding protein [Enterococcus songbeiensis]|uniref:ABC transporter substrate-binding protein n=1 Tax=Enterococcus songbeiensis TaxID=2559927 RepID=UPI0010F6A3BD|nr:sugar ABC transporter substrate-binding protein [Enterococcus songbeiensis]